jgi:hypothetical protein
MALVPIAGRTAAPTPNIRTKTVASVQFGPNMRRVISSAQTAMKRPSGTVKAATMKTIFS